MIYALKEGGWGAEGQDMAPSIQFSGARHGDRGGIVVGWLVKLVVVLGICGIATFDAISISTTAAAVSDDGAFAAREAADRWRDTHDVQLAYEAAVAAAAVKNRGDRLDPKGFRIEPDGTVHLSIRRKAKTVVVDRVGPIAHWAKITQQASGRPSV